MLVSMSFMACKKSTTTPSVPNSPQNPSSPTTPTINVGSDTIGKSKFYFFVKLTRAITTSTLYPDFHYNQNNIRIYHNDSLISFHAGYDTTGVSIDLSSLANYDITPDNVSQPDMPLWVSNGDSLIIEMDSVEYSCDAIYGVNPYHFNKIFIKDKNKQPFDNREIWDRSLAPNNNTGNDLDLGWATSNQSSTQAAVYHWYLSPKKYRLVYIFNL